MSDEKENHSEELAGRSIVLACSERTAGKLLPALRSLGAAVIPLPVIAIRPLEDPAPLRMALRELNSYDWIVFTSSYGVQVFLDLISASGRHEEALRKLKVCAVGPATASTLAQRGIRVDLIPPVFVAESVVEALLEYHGGPDGLREKRFLLPTARESRDVIPSALRLAGADVSVLPVYETIGADHEAAISESLCGEPPDLLVFSSPSAVRGFLGLLGSPDGPRLLAACRVAAIGPITAETLRSHGKQVDILPSRHTASSLVQAIRSYYAVPRGE